MTALRPSEGPVRGVPAKRYPLNKICAHPECDKPVGGGHHIYPRSVIGNSSWFVEFGNKPRSKDYISADAIPHVAGLCGTGTTGHHGDAEQHKAWIKYEGGEFVWYEWRNAAASNPLGGVKDEWVRIGPLDPQPGATKATNPRRGRPNKKGEERRKRRRISVAVPDDSEDGGGLWDDTQDEIKAALIQEGLYDESDKIPAYEAWMAAARDWLDRRAS